MESQKTSQVRTESEAFIPVGGMIAPEIKRKEFSKYLMETGFLKDMSKVILALSEEENLPAPGTEAFIYISKLLGITSGRTTEKEIQESDKLEEELDDRICNLERENHVLRRLLDNYESSATPAPILDPTTLPPIGLQKNNTPTLIVNGSPDN